MNRFRKYEPGTPEGTRKFESYPLPSVMNILRCIYRSALFRQFGLADKTIDCIGIYSETAGTAGVTIDLGDEGTSSA